MSENQSKPTRREFAKKAALLSVAIRLTATGTSESSVAAPRIDDQQPQGLPVSFPKLSDQSRAEAEERYKTILAQYGSRLSEAHKADLKRLSYVLQPSLDRLRAYPVENGDSPALYLKPTVDRDKKPAKTPSPTAATAKKS